VRYTQSISYEEELAVSDKLYARRVLRDSLRAQGQSIGKEVPTNAAERAIWSEGQEAASRLVEAYTPYAWSLAHGVHNRTSRRHSLDVEDLFQTASIAMLVCTWNFDANGARDANGVPLHRLVDGNGKPLGRPGLRFASYAGRHMLKRMNAYVSQASTIMSGNVDVITSTWNYMNTRETLEANSGHVSTPEEVEEASGVSLDNIYRFLPSMSGTMDIHDADFHHPYEDEVSNTVQTLVDYDYHNGLLQSALNLIMSEEDVRILLAFLGMDNGVPRDYPEAARFLKIPYKLAERKERELYDMLKHPRNRHVMRKHIMSVQGRNQLETVSV
jgi:DNA-directed RNA polymerase specialized sigma subunit